jgi:hypothetical protein
VRAGESFGEQAFYLRDGQRDHAGVGRRDLARRHGPPGAGSPASGERAIVSGGHTGISGLDDITELIAHTHPYDLAAQGPSTADYTALNQLGQDSSILLEHGQGITFGVEDPAYLKLFGLGG